MDETRIDKTPTSTHTTINRTETQPSGGNGTMWFLMGGVVVVIAIIAYFVLGTGDLPSGDAAAPAGGNLSINVDTNEAPAAAPEAAAPAAPAAPAEE